MDWCPGTLHSVYRLHGKDRFGLNHQTCAQYRYVDTQEELNLLSARVEGVSRIALDTEADSMHHFFAKVCLIQLTIDEGNYIVDPLAKIDLSGFLQRIAHIPLVLHGSDYDLRMLRTTFGFRPENAVFDTMLASQLLGYTEFGLIALVKRFFDVDLANLGKKTDWSRRPLTTAQLQYACEDTHFLLPLADRLQSQLEEKGRISWHQETCARVVLATGLDKPRDLEKVWRIKGVRFLDRRQLAFLREIWQWRENEAQQVDLPSFKILGNKTLLDIVSWITRHPDASLADGPKLPRNCTGNRLAYLEKAIEKARRMPSTQWPPIRQPQPPVIQIPNCKTQIDAMLSECARIAGELGIASSVLATRSALTAVAHHRPQSIHEILTCSSMMRWQAELLFPSIQKILNQTN